MKKSLSDYDKLEQLFLLYEQKMYALAYGILHQVEQAEDVVQESFIKIMKHLDKIKEPDDEKAKWYILRIVKNTAIDTYRKNRKEHKQIVQMEHQDLEETSSLIDNHMDEIGEDEYLRSFIKDLPSIYLDVIKLHCFYEYSVKETADILKINASTVRKRFERAKKILLSRKGLD
ncbi:MAG: hypothetical protein K0S47_3103 [Herbinix sp.]|nr:hypothetical protein [Herbinix sp.]